MKKFLNLFLSVIAPLLLKPTSALSQEAKESQSTDTHDDIINEVKEYCLKEVVSEDQKDCIRETLRELQDEGLVSFEITDQDLMRVTPFSGWRPPG